MWIRNVLGSFCAGAAVVFLAINSGILARGAAKWGYEPWERLSYGAVAATVPWVIAIMPVLLALSWRPGRRFGRPSIATLAGCIIWLAFVTYNVVGAAGSVAAVRDDVITNREHAANTQEADSEARRRLLDEYGQIPRHRPPGAVAPLLAAQKAMPTWDQTEKCTDIRRGRETKFCSAVTALEAELASGKRAEELQQQLTVIDERLATAPPASRKVDPQARIIATFTGWNEAAITDKLPIATPVILELGSMTLLGFAAMLFGFRHRDLAQELPLPRLGPRANLGYAPATPNITRQRELAEWFFRECTRPVPSGSLPEDAWYQHYRDVCKASADRPLPLKSFRWMAQRFVPAIKEIDGVIYYQQVLPLIPDKVA
jgi:hypothetical protein